MPAASAKSVRENGRRANKIKGATFFKYENGRAVFKIESGTYSFTSEL